MTRIAAITISQITSHGDGKDVTIQLGQHDIPVPGQLGTLLLTLAGDGKHCTGIGSPPDRKWLFPGQLAGKPITPARLAERLRAISVPVMAGRRATLISLAARIPAALLARLLGIHISVAVAWQRASSGDWTAYAADYSRRPRGPKDVDHGAKPGPS